MKLFRGKKGFTLMEAMITIAIMSIVSMGALQMFSQGIHMFNMGMARIQLLGESRMAISAITRLLQVSQADTIKISRMNTTQPANSYLSAHAGETVYATAPQKNFGGCGCSSTSNAPVTYGFSGDPNKPNSIYQYNGYLLTSNPYIISPIDWSNPGTIASKVTYKTVTISANLDSLLFCYEDSSIGTSLVVAARFKKIVFANQPPVEIYLKKNVVIKHFHSAGYYAN